MRILISTSYALNFEIRPGNYGEHEVEVAARSSDWAVGPLRKYPHFAREAWTLFQKSSGYDAVVLLTAGMEAVLLGSLYRNVKKRPRLICADFLIPRPSHALAWLQAGLHTVDAFVCIRRGDIETLERRFGIPPERCSFAPFPCDPRVAETPTSENGYVYSAGWAHRDWATLLRALEQSGAPAILSVGGELAYDGPGDIKILPQRSPEDGRKLMANASVVVLPLVETELPSGPLVMLDAMAMGKAVVVTQVNGSRDYVRHCETAWVVPPGDSRAMADAISRLLDHPALRRKIGCAAQETVLRKFTTDRFLKAVLAACLSK
jgi:glycosyltransferase involved in cell wall biosynthesis